jgi:hypothetical protein
MPEEMKLNPCPFCGREAKHETSDNSGYIAFRIVCTESYCAASETTWYGRKDDAIKKWNSRWNRRTPEPGTSVIRWTRYDGDPDNIPDKMVLFYPHDGRIMCRSIEYINPNDVFWESGDIWACLPEPPEGM